jgi:hypothetical protein
VGGDLQPSNDQMRMSDADREQVVSRLQQAVSEGRLTLPEFEERVDGVLRSRTYGEVEVFVADLPQPGGSVAAPRELVELRNQASNLKRQGRWVVPRRIRLLNRAGSVKLNFVDAAMFHPVVELDIDQTASSLELVLPAGATADLEDIEQIASSCNSKVPSSYDTVTGGRRFVITGRMKASSLKVRYERRFLRWRW